MLGQVGWVAAPAGLPSGPAMAFEAKTASRARITSCNLLTHPTDKRSFSACLTEALQD
jgi:hypothetical protein